MVRGWRGQGDGSPFRRALRPAASARRYPGPDAAWPTRVSSTQMAELIVDDKDLVLRLTLSEKIWSFHGNIRVRLSSILSVAADPRPWPGLRGWRMAGISLAGTVLGTRRAGWGPPAGTVTATISASCTPAGRRSG